MRATTTRISPTRSVALAALLLAIAVASAGFSAEPPASSAGAQAGAGSAKVAGTSSSDAAAYYNRGVALAKAGRHAEAIADYSKAIELNPKYVEAYYERANQYVRSGDYVKAIADCNKAIALNPKLAEAYYLGGVANAFLGRTKEAQADLRRAIELKPAFQANVTALSARFPLAVPNSSSSSDALTKDIQQAVKDLDYPEETARDFAKMLSGWGLAAWKQRIDQAKQDYQAGKISKAQVAQVEESVARELSERIRREIAPNDDAYSLTDAVQRKQANCLAYSQMFYVLGNSIGVVIKTAMIEELATRFLPPGDSHMACLADLTDGKTMMVDVSLKIASKAFAFSEEFSEDGNYWKLKNEGNPLGIHKRIQVLDKNGLLSAGYNNRGKVYEDAGQHAQALSCYAKAIELNPKFAEAYCGRGSAYGRSGRYPEAIVDCTKGIELNPKYADAYYNRGLAYGRWARHTEAIADCTKAIELNPKFAAAYRNRGVAYATLGRSAEASRDLRKASELDPALSAKVKAISDQFKLGL